MQHRDVLLLEPSQVIDHEDNLVRNPAGLGRPLIQPILTAAGHEESIVSEAKDNFVRIQGDFIENPEIGNQVASVASTLILHRIKPRATLIFSKPVPGHHLEHQGFGGLSIMDGVHSLCSIRDSELHASRVKHQHPPLFDPKETQAFCGAKFPSRQVRPKQLVQEPCLAFRAFILSRPNKHIGRNVSISSS